MGTHDTVKGTESRFFYGFISWAVGESFIENFLKSNNSYANFIAS